MCFVCALKRNNNTTFVIFCDINNLIRLIPPDIANQIIGMAAAGATQGAIAARYGVHRHSVRNILRRHALTGTTRHRPITGRPRVTTPAQDRFLLNTSSWSGGCKQGRQSQQRCRAQASPRRGMERHSLREGATRHLFYAASLLSRGGGCRRPQPLLMCFF